MTDDSAAGDLVSDFPMRVKPIVEVDDERPMMLTVAIPTFKRPLLLEKCIESVLASAGQHDIELLVCDDSTDDSNAALYARLVPRDPRIRLVRNSVNLGIDANICACLEMATGRYVWLIGEDDLMRVAGVSTVLEKIDTGADYPFIFVNYSYITADQTKEFRHRSIEIETTEISFRSFYATHLWSTGFIGGCVIHRERFLKTNYGDFIGTYFAHVAGLSLASAGQTIGVIAAPMIGNRVGNAATFTWSADSFGVFQGWRVMLQKLRRGLGDTGYGEAYQSHTRAHGYLGYKFLIAKKADGLLTPANVDSLLSSEISAEERGRILLVARTVPALLCKTLRSVYARLRRPRLRPFTLA